MMDILNTIFDNLPEFISAVAALLLALNLIKNNTQKKVLKQQKK